jgi:DNA-binding CsgD family transcriptional regulator
LAFLYAGDLAGALADAQAALDLAGDTGQVLSIGYAAACLADAFVETGDFGAAEKVLADQGPLFGPEAPFTGNYLHAARGRLHLAVGRYPEAAVDLRECGRRVAAWGVRNPALCRWQAPLALALAGLGEPAEAAAVADEAVGLARRWGAPEPLAEALRAAGAVAGVDRGLALLREAAAVAETGESRLERAHALVALGSALRRAGLRREAREPLRAAIGLAAACGAAPLANRAREDLVAAGARPRRAQAAGRAGLTPTELRVARMAAEGLTNRAVAQALFVSEKTIETHLGRAYRKLGITARSQLTRALRSAAGEGVLG